MPFRTSLKQLFRAPVKLVVYFLIMALAAALLCVGLNLNRNAQRNVAAADAAFETVAVARLSAHILPDGTLCTDFNDPSYAGYLPCFAQEYDLAPVLAAPGVESVDVRGRFGARVNVGNDSSLHSDIRRRGMVSDVIIFTVNAPERITVRPSSEPVSVPATVTFSVLGTDYYQDTLEFNNFISAGNLQGIVMMPYAKDLPGPLFDIGTEESDGSFYLEPGKRYIAAVTVGMMWHSTADKVRAAGIYISVVDEYHPDNRQRYSKTYGWTWSQDWKPQPYVPIAMYDDGFFGTERGAYFQEIIDAYRTTLNSLNAIATNDLAAMRAFHSGGVYIPQGRAFTAEEYAQGAKVCIVSEYMAELNGWHIGDTLSLSFYGADYLFNKKAERYSEFRMPTEDFFGEGSYEIVGMYAGNVVRGEDPAGYTKDEGLDALDILLPAASVSNAPVPRISEYTTGIRLKNSAAQDFMAHMAAASGLMQEQEGGYELGLTVYDQGYSHVAPGLRQLSRVSALTLALSCAAAGLAVLVLAVVQALRGRREVAAMRSLGTRRSQITVIALAGIVLTCFVGACAGAYAGHTPSADVTARVIESAGEDAADTTFTAMMGEDEQKEYKFLMESDAVLAFASGGAAALAFALCAGLLLALEFRKSPMLLLGVKE